MSRLARLHDNAAATLIDGMSNDVRELRTRQSIPRTLTTQAYLTTNPGTWDLSSIAVPANTTDATHSITWTSDGTQPAPWVYLKMQVFNGSTQLSDYEYTTSANGGYTARFPGYSATQNTLGAKNFKWTLRLIAPTSSAGSFNVKVSVLASTKGTLLVA